VAAEVVILSLRKSSEGRFAHTVTQDDIAELERLSAEFSAARLAWEKKRDWIKGALRARASVEPGAFSVELVKGKGGGYQVEVFEYEKVVVR